MANTRIEAVDVGNDSLKAIFGKMEAEVNIPNVIARDVHVKQDKHVLAMAIEGDIWSFEKLA